MSVTLSDAAAGQIVHDGLPTVFPATAILDILSGTPPGPGAAETGTKLASIVLPASPWAAVSGRTVPKSGTWSVAAIAAGTAGYYRLKQSGDTNAAVQTQPRIEGTVTATGGGGDLTLDNTNIANGQTVTINTFTIGL